jgi:dTDP-4-dehydrorhamnose reductase
MRVLILGGEGMLGHKVFQILNGRFEVYATFRDTGSQALRFPVYVDADPSRLICGVDALYQDAIVCAIGKVRPDVVINCIGIVKQLKAATDPILTLRLNSLLPNQLADLCVAAGARLIHISTDCVFSGRRGRYKETDQPDPDDLYGRSKLLGEVDRPGSITIRTSIFGRDFLKRDAFLEWFLSHRSGKVRGYVNHIYTGFPTQVMARIIGDLLADHANLSGLIQVASEPISKHDLLVMIRDALGLHTKIEPFEAEPCDRSLDGAHFLAKTGYQVPTWQAMVSELAEDLTPYDTWWGQTA